MLESFLTGMRFRTSCTVVHSVTALVKVCHVMLQVERS